MKTFKIISLVIIIFLTTGCESILSDRNKCPCYFTLDFSTLGDEVKDIHLWIIDSNNVVIHSDYILAQDYREFYEIQVPRGSLKVHSWGNAGINTTIEDLKSSNSSLIITQNKADSLFSDTKRINTNQETAADTIRVRAEFTTLAIEVLNSRIEDSVKITINNATKGFYINREQISSFGKLTPKAIKSKDGIIFSCLILRQESMLKDLTLSIDGRKNGENYNVYSYPLGKKLIESGYNMSSADLESISIIINSTLSLIKINTLDWEYIDHQKIKI